MITLKKINLNCPYCFFSNMTNVKNFNANLLNINKISYKNADAVVCNIKYIMMESFNNQNIYSQNHLCFNDVDGYIIEESNENKYLILALTKNNKKLLKHMLSFLMKLKMKLKQ